MTPPIQWRDCAPQMRRPPNDGSLKTKLFVKRISEMPDDEFARLSAMERLMFSNLNGVRKPAPRPFDRKAYAERVQSDLEAIEAERMNLNDDPIRSGELFRRETALRAILDELARPDNDT